MSWINRPRSGTAVPAGGVPLPRRSRRARIVGSVALAMALLGVATFVPRGVAAVADTPLAPRSYPSVHGGRALTPTARPKVRDDASSAWHATPTTWPAAGSAEATLAARPAAATTVRAGGLPVRLGRAGASGPSKVAVTLADHAAADRLGVSGLLLQLTPRSGAAGKVDLAVDYSAIADAYGGDYAGRLQLVTLPACALTTPDVPLCRTRSPLRSARDRATGSVSAQVFLPAAVPAPAVAAPTVVALTAAASGDTGTYGATSLAASGSWTAGGNSGDFTYSYPITAPPVPGSLVPAVALNYSAQSVDGEQVSTNNQSSWIGDGWSYSPGYVERSYVGCSDSAHAGAPATSDDCWAGQVLHVAFGSTSGDIVHDDVTNKWKLSDDDGTDVQYIAPADKNTTANGTFDGGYWQLTTVDGTRYSFGLNKLPGWATGKTTTQSAWTLPVYDHPDGCTAASCQLAWRWNLDYVVDTHQDAAAYYYSPEHNYYGANKSTTGVLYERGGWLDHIDYGLKDPNAYSSAPARFTFGTKERCIDTEAVCAPANITANKSAWPDVPSDQLCNQGKTCDLHAPTFFSRKRLTSITTQITNGAGGWTTVDSYALDQGFPNPNDNTSPSLWLKSIQHTAGTGTSAIKVPMVTFAATNLPNRADGLDGAPAMNHNRVSVITTETGETVGVNYKTECTAPVKLDPKTNTSLCYPVYWTKQGNATASLDWFHKYVVTEIDDQDTSNKTTPPVTTTYEYLDGGAWHYDDNELVKAKYRTWGQWRGFGRVRTRVGGGNDVKTLTENRFYRGMDGDYLSAASTRSATVSLSGDVPVPGAATAVADRNQLAGQARETIVYKGSSGAADHATVADFWIGSATATRKRSGLSDLTATMSGNVADRTTSAITSASPATWRTTLIETSYDPSTGLPAEVYDHSDITKPDQARCTTTSYAPANTTLHVIGLPAQVEVDAAPCAGSGINGLTPPSGISRPADVVSLTRTFYDRKDFSTAWPQAAPTAGDNTMRQVASDYQNGAYTWITTQRTTFDGYGRPKKTLDAKDNATTTTYTDTNGLTTQTLSTNQLGQTQTTTLEPTRGAVTSSEDANHLITDVRRDALGRTTGVWLPGRDRTLGANSVFSYTLGATVPSTVTTQTMMDNGKYATSVSFYDSLRRLRQTQAPTPVGGRVLADTFYDTHGWAYKINNSYYDNSSGPSTIMLDMTGKDQQIPDQDVYTFDGMGRTTADVSNLKGVEQWRTTTVYGGDRITVLPPDGGTPTTTISDAGGRPIETDWYTSAPTVSGDRITGGTHVKHTSTYDTKTTTVTDDAGAKWSSTVDLLGQQISTTDPDVGASSVTYDALGNVATTTDGRGKTVAYDYDAMRRPTGLFDGADTTAPQLARWTYDTAAPYGVGKPASSTRFDRKNGSTYEYTTSVTKGYNVFGNALGTSVTIPADPANGALAGTYNYASKFSTTTGLLTRDDYEAHGGLPAEKVGHTYNVLDLPVAVGGNGNYTDSTIYTPFGQVDTTKMGLGTGAKSSQLAYQYDEHTQLLKHSQLTGYTGGPIVDETSYLRNDAGSITSATDVRNGSASETQCYQYDLLSRLSAAWTATDKCAADVPATGSTATIGGINPYWTSWSYNSSGERTQQIEHGISGTAGDTTTTYAYPAAGAAQPHTLQTASTTGPGATTPSTFGYDLAGNTVQRTTAAHGSQIFTWNSEGHLAAVAADPNVPATDGSDNASYVYDANGGMLLERDTTAGKSTLYLPGEELTLSTTSGLVSGRRYYAGPGATAVRTGTADDAYNFLVDDPQGTQNLTLDHDTKNPVWRDRTPYGGERGTQPFSWPDTHAYLGQPTDSATGLDIFGARQYDPVLGRFLSADPVLETGDPNQIGGYTYSGDDPVNGTDADGLWKRQESEGGGGGGTATTTGGGGGGNSGTGQGGGTVGGSDTGGGGGKHNGGHSKHGWSGVGWGLISGVKSFAVDPWVDMYHYGIYQYHQDKAMDEAFWRGDASAWDMTKFIGNQMWHASGLTMIWNFGKGTYNEFHDGVTSDNAYDRTQHFTSGGLNIASLFFDGEVLDGFKGTQAATDTAKGAEGAADAGKGAEGAADAGKGSKGGEEPSDSGGPKCHNSFAPATLVLMADGTSKPIDQIELGDQVASADPANKITVGEPVSLLHRAMDNDLYDIKVADGTGARTTLHTTANHLVWDVTQRGWVASGDLRPGDTLLSPKGVPGRVLSARSIPGVRPMYNLTVDNLHTYYVLAGSTPVLVHNDGGDDGTLGRDDLTSEQLRNLTRYEKKLPAGAEPTAISRGADGAVQFEAKVPGRVPGSYANYTKTVDPSGNTIGYTKTTIVPDGSVAHVKDKMAGGC